MWGSTMAPVVRITRSPTAAPVILNGRGPSTRSTCGLLPIGDAPIWHRFRRARLSQRGRILRRGFEIVMPFNRAGVDNDAISGVRLKCLRAGALDGGMHAANLPAVYKIFHRSGIGLGHQMPDRLRI